MMAETTVPSSEGGQGLTRHSASGPSRLTSLGFPHRPQHVPVTPKKYSPRERPQIVALTRFGPTDQPFYEPCLA